MKYIIGILLVIAAGYMTYAYITAETPQSETSSTESDYSGKWDIVMLPVSGAQCVKATVSGTILKEEMKSVMEGNDGVRSIFVISVHPDGTIRNTKSANLTSFDGLVFGGVGNGKWSDKYGCAGTFVMRRAESIDQSEYGSARPPSNGQNPELEQNKSVEY